MGFDPISMGLAALSAGTSLMSSNAQNDAITEQQKAVAGAARMNMNMEAARQDQIKAQAGMELTQANMKRLEQQGKIKVAQAESGAAGNTSVRQLADNYLKSSLEKGSIISKEEAQLVSSGLQQTQTYLGATSQLNQLESNKVSPLEMITQAAISGVGGYMMGGGTFGGGAAAGEAAKQAALAKGLSAGVAEAAYASAAAGWGSTTLGATLFTSGLSRG